MQKVTGLCLSNFTGPQNEAKGGLPQEMLFATTVVRFIKYRTVKIHFTIDVDGTVSSKSWAMFISVWKQKKGK